jgi:hypothetical protein
MVKRVSSGSVFRIRIRMDLIHFWEAVTLTKYSTVCVESQKLMRGESVDLWSQIRVTIESGSGSGSASKLKVGSGSGSASKWNVGFVPGSEKALNLLEGRGSGSGSATLK